MRVESIRFPEKRATLPDKVAPSGNQESLMAKRTALPAWTLPVRCSEYEPRVTDKRSMRSNSSEPEPTTPTWMK